MLKYMFLLVTAVAISLSAKAFSSEIDSTSSDTVQTLPQMTITNIDTLMNNAKELYGIRYRYGGTDKKGFDCSGFMQYIMAESGIEFPRVSVDQYCLGDQVAKISEVLPGDLLFFNPRNRAKRVGHVGIVSRVEDGKIYMIHASSSRGISEVCYNECSYWKSRFIGAKRWWF
ncbi:MAG: C40 family peptidase [Flavobacteriales bacterium]